MLPNPDFIRINPDYLKHTEEVEKQREAQKVELKNRSNFTDIVLVESKRRRFA